MATRQAVAMESTHETMAGAIAYANRRHMETGRRYIVSQFGHAWMDCAHNRRGFAELGFAVFYRSRRT